MQAHTNHPMNEMPENYMLKTFMGNGVPLDQPDPALFDATGVNRPAAPAAGVVCKKVTTHSYRPDSRAVDELLVRSGITDEMLLLDDCVGGGVSTTTGGLNSTTVTDAGCDHDQLPDLQVGQVETNIQPSQEPQLPFCCHSLTVQKCATS